MKDLKFLSCDYKLELTQFISLKILLIPRNFDTECIDSKHLHNYKIITVLYSYFSSIHSRNKVKYNKIVVKAKCEIV